MKKPISLIIFFALFLCTISAQSEFKKPVSNFTLGTEASSLIFCASASINAELHLYSTKSSDFHVYARGGLGTGYLSKLLCQSVIFKGRIIGLTFLNGSGNSHLEMNTSIYHLSSQKISESQGSSCHSKRKNNIMPFFNIGYRYQRPEGGVYFSVKVGTLGIGIGLGYAI